MRAVGILRKAREMAPEDANAALADFVQARWKGIHPVADGQTAQQVIFNLRLYRRLLSIDMLPRSGMVEPYPTERTA